LFLVLRLIREEHYYYYYYYSSRSMALVLAQPLTEMTTRNLPGGRGEAANSDNLSVICELIVWKMWHPQRLASLHVSMACYRDSFALLLVYKFKLIRNYAVA
jgi:hypothetical protein